MSETILQSTGYSGALLQRLKELYDQGQLCDFRLVVNSTEVLVHSAVLCSASRYFKALMDQNSLQEPRYYLQTSSVDCLRTLIHFMYTGCLSLSQSNIWVVLALASQLDVPEAIDLCQQYLQETPKKAETSVEKIPFEFGESSLFTPQGQHDFSEDDDMFPDLDDPDPFTESMTDLNEDQVSVKEEVEMIEKTTNQGHQDSSLPESQTELAKAAKSKRRKPGKNKSKPEEGDQNKQEGIKIRLTRIDVQNKREGIKIRLARTNDQNKQEGIKIKPARTDDQNKQEGIKIRLARTDLCTNDLEESPKRRGRPKGSKNKPKNHKEKIRLKNNLTPIAATSKRKTAKPRKVENSQILNDIDSETEDISHFIGNPRRRGRPKGSGTKPKPRLLRDDKKYTCMICQASFPWHSLLELHCRSHITVGYRYHHTKLLLNSSLKNERLFRYTSEGGTPYKCDSCLSSFRLHNHLRAHKLKKHHKSFPLKCDSCSTRRTTKYFSNRKLLFMHNTRCHSKPGLPLKRDHLQCHGCGLMFIHRKTLMSHKAGLLPWKGCKKQTSGSGSKQSWSCVDKTCDFIALSRLQLKQHVQQSHPDLEYTCTLCSFTTKVKCVLDRHKRIAHEKSSDSIMCYVCGKLFPKQIRLKLHMFSRHKIQDPSLKVYQCQVEGCNYTCALKDMINRHMVKHTTEKPFTCEICGKSFKKQLSVEKHTAKVHLRIRNYICDICGMTYGEEAELKVHMARHSDYKPYSCNRCDYSTYDKGNYKTHLYGIHGVKLDEHMKIHECKLCDFKTTTKYRFSDHMRVHMEMRDIPCPECDKLFMTRKAMRGHINKVHKPKDLRCEICAYVTSDRTKLNDHIRIMHTHRNFKPYKCPYCPFQCATGGNCRKHVKHRHKDQEVTYIKLTSTAEATIGYQETQLSVDHGNSNHEQVEEIKGTVQQNPYQAVVPLLATQGSTVVDAENIMMQSINAAGIGVPYDNLAWHMIHQGQYNHALNM